MSGKMWIIYKIDRKTRIPKQYGEGEDDQNLPKMIAELQKDKEHIYAVRFNLMRKGE